MEVPSLDDFMAIMRAYEQTWDRSVRLGYLKQIEQMFRGLLEFATRVGLAGYDMTEWRRKLFVPFDAEFNSLVTNYTTAVEMAQSGQREELAGILKRAAGRRLEMAYYRELAGG